MRFIATVLAVALSAMFRGGPAHLGVYDSTAPKLTSVKWRFHTHAKIFSSPTVNGDAVYVGASDGHLYAVRIADGSSIWSFAAKGAINSTPAVADGAVIISSRDGNVYAIDAATGRKRWSFTTGGERRFTAPGFTGSRPRPR